MTQIKRRSHDGTFGTGGIACGALGGAFGWGGCCVFGRETVQRAAFRGKFFKGRDGGGRFHLPCARRPRVCDAEYAGGRYGNAGALRVFGFLGDDRARRAFGAGFGRGASGAGADSACAATREHADDGVGPGGRPFPLLARIFARRALAGAFACGNFRNRARDGDGNRSLCARGALRVLFRAVSHEFFHRRAERKPRGVRAAVPDAVHFGR